MKSSFAKLLMSIDIMVVSRFLPPDHEIDFDILVFNHGFNSEAVTYVQDFNLFC